MNFKKYIFQILILIGNCFSDNLFFKNKWENRIEIGRRQFFGSYSSNFSELEFNVPVIYNISVRPSGNLAFNKTQDIKGNYNINFGIEIALNETKKFPFSISTQYTNRWIYTEYQALGPGISEYRKTWGNLRTNLDKKIEIIEDNLSFIIGGNFWSLYNTDAVYWAAGWNLVTIINESFYIKLNYENVKILNKNDLQGFVEITTGFIF